MCIMLTRKLRQVILFIAVQLSYSERRVRDGQPAVKEHNFVVYFIKAPVSPQDYDEWLCGGALVTKEFVITSAACVEDVQHLYVIAGYSKYVPQSKLQTDPCTKETKKKVVFICVPKSYEFNYLRIEKWSYIDIAVVKVESPYNFEDEVYKKVCSYPPGVIAVNYEPRYQEPGLDVMVFGWGHKEKWRHVDDNTDYNQEALNYASTLLHDKEDCKRLYKNYPNMHNVIDRYMICTMGEGSLNDAGEQVMKTKPKLVDGCTTTQQRLAGIKGLPCNEDEEEIVLIDQTRRKSLDLNETQSTIYRRHGICQNDHGGPLITWVGTHEILIGVASVFMVNNQSQCQAPYLFTSTQCNGAFLDCILTSGDPESLVETTQATASRRRDICDSAPSKKGFDTIEREISWLDHPDGPADNEKERNLEDEDLDKLFF